MGHERESGGEVPSKDYSSSHEPHPSGFAEVRLAEVLHPQIIQESLLFLNFLPGKTIKLRQKPS